MAIASARQRWVGLLGSFLALVLGTAIIASSILTLRAASGTSRLGLGKTESVGQVTTAVAVMVVAFVLAATFAFVVDQRSRELALLRLIGASPRRIRSVIRAEAIITGTLAGVVGCLLGVPGSWLMRSWMVAKGIAPGWFHVGFDAIALLIALIISIGAAIAGSASAGWRASRIPPLAGLRAAVASPRVMTPLRWILGGLLLAVAGTVAIAIAVISPLNAAQPGAYFEVPMLIAGGLAVLAPALVRPIARIVTRPLLRFGALPTLLRQNILHGGRRIGAIVTPTVIAVGTVTAMLTMQRLSVGLTTDPSAGDDNRLANVVILGISVTYALLAIANTLVMNVAVRRTELSNLGLVGATRRQIVGVVVGEAILSVVVGAVLGIAAAAVEATLQILTLSRVTDAPSVGLPWAAFGQVVALCAATAALAALVAGLRLTRPRTAGARGR